MGPIPLIPLLAWQAGLALCLVAPLADRVLLVPAAVVLALVVVATIVHLGHRPLWRVVRVRARYRARRRAATRPPCRDGFPLAAHEALVPVLHLRPHLTVTAAAGRTGEPAGVICDGRAVSAILRPDDEPVVPAFLPVSFGIGVLADLCDADGADLDSAQLLIRLRPAPARDLAALAPAVADSYRQVNPDGAAAAVSWLIAVRMDPVDSANALDTGAAVDLADCVRSRANRAAKTLGASGLSCRMLGEQDAVTALAESVDADRRRPRPAHSRFQERATSVLVDGLTHQIGWLRGFATDSPDGVTSLLTHVADLDVLSSTVSIVVTVTEQRRLRCSVYLRLTATTPAGCATAMRTLRARLRRSGADLAPLTAEQAPGLLATVPLGGEVI